MKLPAPHCVLGYTHAQVKEMFGTVGIERFYKWMAGQTICTCPGTEESAECQHLTPMTIYYTSDVERYIKGLPVID